MEQDVNYAHGYRDVMKIHYNCVNDMKGKVK